MSEEEVTRLGKAYLAMLRVPMRLKVRQSSHFQATLCSLRDEIAEYTHVEAEIVQNKFEEQAES